jgi:Rrf2 family protein
MKLSTRSRYSTRILLDLAQQTDQVPVQVRTISDRQKIPPKYIEQLIRTLKRVGWVASRRGPKGGHYLAGDAKTISLGDIVRLFEGQPDLVGCIHDTGSCPDADRCAARTAWRDAAAALFDKLDNITIADLICDPSVID